MILYVKNSPCIVRWKHSDVAKPHRIKCVDGTIEVSEAEAKLILEQNRELVSKKPFKVEPTFIEVNEE